MQLTALSLALTRIGLRGLDAYSPALNLDLTSGNQTLDPRITFSRASNATVTGPDGVLRYAPHNLLTYSEQFDNATWGVAAATITANSTAAPNGTSTADSFTETSSSGDPRLPVTTSLVPGNRYTLSVYAKVKPGSAQRYLMLVFNAGFGAVTGGNFNLAAGSVGETLNSVGVIEDVGNGWYRCSITPTLTATSSGSLRIRVAAVDTTANIGGPVAYTGDGTSGFYIWGAQLNVGSLQPYYPTTVKNLLGFTQEFDNAAWTKSNATVTANSVVAPDGSMTADKLVENTANSTHLIESAAVTLIAAPVTASIYAKADGRGWINIRYQGITRAYFDVANGLLGAVSASTSAFIEEFGGGWYRCSVSFTPTAGAGNVFFRMASSDGVDSYTGDGTSGIYIWGAQLSDSDSLDPYVYNPGAAPAAAAYYGPRFDYDPVTLQPKGLLIEEQRTNSIRNNTMQGAVVGTPGTVPTNWNMLSLTSGLTRSILGVGYEAGYAYIDVRYSGTTTAAVSGAVVATCETTTGVPATAGQVWTSSWFLRLVNGSTAGLGSLTIQVSERDVGGALSGASSTSVVGVTDAALGGQRYALTRTLSGATTVAVQSDVRMTVPLGATIDITLRIGMPQLELGAFATSVIPTTTAAATRAADVAVMTGANFSNWYNQSEGTLFAEGDSAGGSTPCFISLDDTTANNRIQLRRGANIATIASFHMASSGVGIDVTLTTPASTLFRQAAAAKAGDQSAAANGALFTGIAPLANMPLISQAVLGNGIASTYLNGHIRRIAYWPRRLTNTELQGVTA